MKKRKKLVIDADALKAAMTAGGFIDASRLVLGRADAIETSDGRTGVHRPPLLVAGRAFDAHGAIPDPSAAERRRPDGADLRRQALCDFEVLSLAARVALLTGHRGEGGAPASPSDADAALLKAAQQEGVKLDLMPVVRPQDILEALAWAADELARDAAHRPSGMERLALRGGLQLVGVRIAPDDGVKPEKRYADGLRLVNANLPFSLRLVGCVIDCPLLLSHCSLVSLDLSGSAINAVDATGLVASGSVYLRRSVVRTPVSFAGAKIAGTFNASDAAIAPFMSLPEQMPVDPDNGILNLSRASIESDVRLSRARIWGGISLRGAQIGRSLFMEEAVVVSPLAMLEKNLPAGGASNGRGSGVGRALARADEALARSLFTPWGDGKTPKPTLISMEILEPFTRHWPELGDRTFPQLPLRALMTAVRADGLEVNGTVFARQVVCNGKWRMKYAVVDGAVRMDDSLFRSPAEVLDNPDVAALLKSTLERFPAKSWVEEGVDVALDLRETRARGDLSLGWEDDPADVPDDGGRSSDPDKPKDWPGIENRRQAPHADIFGRVRMSGFATQATIRFKGTVFHAVAPELEAHPSPPSGAGAAAPVLRRSFATLLNIMFMRGHAESWTASGILSALTLAPWRLLHGAYRKAVPARPVAPPPLSPDLAPSGLLRARLNLAASREPALDMTQVSAGRDVDLRETSGIYGLSLENAEIGGDLKMAQKAETRPFVHLHPGWVACLQRADDVRGRLNLRSSEIAGDAYLVFDARQGPAIDAAMMQVKGQLGIYPQISGQAYRLTPETEHRLLSSRTQREIFRRPKLSRTHFPLMPCSHPDVEVQAAESAARPAGRYCRDCGMMTDKIEDNQAWTIDLRSARATVFAHPPAAWPDPGGLRLEGFTYHQASDMGPLAPHAPRAQDDLERQEVRRLRYEWRHRHLDRNGLALAVAAALAGIGFGTAWLGWRAASALISNLGRGVQVPWGVSAALLAGCALLAFLSVSQRWKPWTGLGLFLAAVAAGLAGVMSLDTGALLPAPSLIAISSVLAAIVVGANVLMTLNPGKGFFSSRFDAKPMALEYLERQRVAENRFKLRPSGYPVLESYGRAARALRESGRYISANMVEEERLRKRTQMLSWRHHGAAKLILTAVDVFAGYGFRLSRALSVLALTVCGVALLAHWAAANEYLVATPQTDESAAALARAVTDAEPPGGVGSAMVNTRPQDRSPARASPYAVTNEVPAAVNKPARCGKSGAAASIDQDCPDMVYAADMLLPFIDLGEGDRWTAVVPRHAEADIRAMEEPFQSLWVSILRSWPALISGLGLLLTAVMATAIASRVESAFARVEE